MAPRSNVRTSEIAEGLLPRDYKRPEQLRRADDRDRPAMERIILLDTDGPAMCPAFPQRIEKLWPAVSGMFFHACRRRRSLRSGLTDRVVLLVENGHCAAQYRGQHIREFLESGAARDQGDQLFMDGNGCLDLRRFSFQLLHCGTCFLKQPRVFKRDCRMPCKRGQQRDFLRHVGSGSPVRDVENAEDALF